MQELPELEIYRALLAERFAGARITAVRTARARTTEQEESELAKAAVGAAVWYVERRDAYLIFHLDNGKRLMLEVAPKSYLYCGTADEKPIALAAAAIHFGDRILGLHGFTPDRIRLRTVKEVEAQLKTSGIDPLDKRFTLSRFKELFAKRRIALKTALTDRASVAGIGSVYSDEIAFAAGLLPNAKLAGLSPEAWERLYQAVGAVLKEAISHGGIGDRPLFAGDALTGGYIDRLHVYGRENEHCDRCGGMVEKLTVSGRKAFACRGCQSEG